MGVVQFQIKTHKRTVLTHLFPNISPCIIHNQKPAVMEIIAGRRKEKHFVVICKHDEDCNKISMESVEVAVNAWEKYNNPNRETVKKNV